MEGREYERLFQDDCKRGHNDRCNSVTVDNQHVVTHPFVQCSLTDDIHSREAKLQEDNCDEGLHPL